jgi:hypothetical protein
MPETAAPPTRRTAFGPTVTPIRKKPATQMPHRGTAALCPRPAPAEEVTQLTTGDKPVGPGRGGTKGVGSRPGPGRQVLLDRELFSGFDPDGSIKYALASSIHVYTNSPAVLLETCKNGGRHSGGLVLARRAGGRVCVGVCSCLVDLDALAARIGADPPWFANTWYTHLARAKAATASPPQSPPRLEAQSPLRRATPMSPPDAATCHLLRGLYQGLDQSPLSTPTPRPRCEKGAQLENSPPGDCGWTQVRSPTGRSPLHATKSPELQTTAREPRTRPDPSGVAHALLTMRGF